MPPVRTGQPQRRTATQTRRTAGTGRTRGASSTSASNPRQNATDVVGALFSDMQNAQSGSTRGQSHGQGPGAGQGDVRDRRDHVAHQRTVGRRAGGQRKGPTVRPRQGQIEGGGTQTRPSGGHRPRNARSGRSVPRSKAGIGARQLDEMDRLSKPRQTRTGDTGRSSSRPKPGSVRAAAARIEQRQQQQTQQSGHPPGSGEDSSGSSSGADRSARNAPRPGAVQRRQRQQTDGSGTSTTAPPTSSDSSDSSVSGVSVPALDFSNLGATDADQTASEVGHPQAGQGRTGRRGAQSGRAGVVTSGRRGAATGNLSARDRQNLNSRVLSNAGNSRQGNTPGSGTRGARRGQGRGGADPITRRRQQGPSPQPTTGGAYRPSSESRPRTATSENDDALTHGKSTRAGDDARARMRARHKQGPTGLGKRKQWKPQVPTGAPAKAVTPPQSPTGPPAKAVQPPEQGPAPVPAQEPPAPAQASAQEPPAQALAQEPPAQVPTQDPPAQAPAQDPPAQAPAQDPPAQAPAQEPPVAQEPPAQDPGLPDPEVNIVFTEVGGADTSETQAQAKNRLQQKVQQKVQHQKLQKRLKQRAAAKVLQKNVRIRQSNQRLGKFQKTVTDAVAKDKQEKLDQLMATRIQANYRGRLGRQSAKKAQQKQEAARTLQKMARGHLARVKFQDTKRNDAAAREIQRVFRGSVGRTEARNEAAALAIQRVARQYIQKQGEGDLNFIKDLARDVVSTYGGDNNFGNIKPDESLPKLKAQMSRIGEQIDKLDDGELKDKFSQVMENAQNRLDFLSSDGADVLSDGAKLGEMRVVLEMINDVIDTSEGIDKVQLRGPDQLDQGSNESMELYQILHETQPPGDPEEQAGIIQGGFMKFVVDNGLLKGTLQAQELDGVMTVAEDGAGGYVATTVSQDFARLVHDQFMITTGVSGDDYSENAEKFEQEMDELYKAKSKVSGDDIFEKIRNQYSVPLGSGSSSGSPLESSSKDKPEP